MEQADFNKIFGLYKLRWRIEIIFKSWKSEMRFDNIHQVSAIQLKVLLLSRFIMILFCTQYIFPLCNAIVKKRIQKDLSLLKVIHYLMRKQEKLFYILNDITKNSTKSSDNIAVMAKYCSYDKRRRINYQQCLDEVLS